MKHFFDIGANVGQTFDWLATQPHDYRDHQFWCFEPSPRHFAALIEKCRVQSAKGYRINLCPFGISGATEFVRFFEKDDPKGDSFEAWTASDHSPKNVTAGYAVMAATRSLSETIMALTDPGDTVVLDIDAEGAEYAMLLDLNGHEAMSRVRRILVEFHFIAGRDCPESKKALVECYSRHGLQLEVRGFVP
jgi:FkbM family methyltransferase